MIVPRGLRALAQSSASRYEDRFENPALPLVVPQQADFEVWVHLDAQDPPRTIMLELNTTKGLRRALWGDAEMLGSGCVGSPERLRQGDLPANGRWTRLTVPGTVWNLEGGELVSSVALAQYGGRMHWDALAVRGTLPPCDDPRASFTAWWKSSQGRDTSAVPDELKGALKDGPGKEPSAEVRKKLEVFFLAYIARPSGIELSQARAVYDAAVTARITLEDQIPGTLTFQDIGEPRQAVVMLRGKYDKPGDPVEPGVPIVLPPLRKDDPNRRATRLDLARWLIAPEHPLTSRVAVNRIWQQFFGTGLVKTSFDFGAQGEQPSHPELLDWLAIYYRESGWDTKALVELIVTSAAFRQDSRILPEVFSKDPENRLLARGPRIRLDAEQVRDNALFVSGLINLQMGGPGVRPYQPPNLWEPVGYGDSNTRFYLQDHGIALYRRGIYCFLKRTAPPPFMSTFDGPNREQFCARRERSNTPLQALQLMNDVQHFEAARVFAERILRDGGSTVDERLTFAYRTALARTPKQEELQVVRAVLDQFLARFQADEKAAQQVAHAGESKPSVVASAPELAAYTLVANVILNLDETITRN
jgi:hypothetical protein